MKYFKPEEFHDFMKMNSLFLVKIDLLREKLGHPMIITSSNKMSGHTTSSDHYTGHAIDFVTSANGKDVIECVEEIGFGGFGIYHSINGLYYHIADGGKDKNDKWIGIAYTNGNIIYRQYNEENLRKVLA